MNIIGIIPARMASTRFPNKPMANILGMPMIGHCLKRSLMCNLLTDVYVATCDKIIYDYIESVGGKAIMTLDTHERASDRTAEAMLKIEKKIGEKIDIVVLLQGDEPMTNASMIESAVNPLLDDSNLPFNIISPQSIFCKSMYSFGCHYWKWPGRMDLCHLCISSESQPVGF